MIGPSSNTAANELTFTVPATPALATLGTILSIHEEVVIGFPCSIVAGFTVLKQTAAWQGQKKKSLFFAVFNLI